MNKQTISAFLVPFLIVISLTSGTSGYSLQAWDNFTGPTSGFGWSTNDWRLPTADVEGDDEIIGEIEYTLYDTAILTINPPLQEYRRIDTRFSRRSQGQTSAPYYVECRARAAEGISPTTLDIAYGPGNWPFFRNASVDETWTVLTGSVSNPYSPRTVNLEVNVDRHEPFTEPVGLEIDYIIITKDGPFEKWNGEFFPWDSGYGEGLVLLAPNGGESLFAGDAYSITWQSNPNISDVIIKYSTDNGSIWNDVVPPNTGNSGTYDWLVPDISSGECLVRIIDASNLNIRDTSDAVFRLSNPSIHNDTQNTWHKTIQEAINAANSGDEIVVGPTRYAGQGNKNIDFEGKAVKLLSLNGPVTTIIDLENDGRAFNFHSGEDNTCMVRGFTITRGYIIGSSAQGAGIHISNSSPTLKDLVISGCVATNGSGGSGYSSYGGAIYMTNSASILDNLVITDNLVTDGVGGQGATAFGGGIYMNDCLATLTNLTLVNNRTERRGGGGSQHGGGIFCQDSNSLLANSILWNTGEAIYDTGGEAQINATYCNVQGGWPGEGNIDADPMFVDTVSNDYHLQSASPCIDTGDPSYVSLPGETDLDGNPRVVNDRIDMGAYENQDIRLADLLVTSEDLEFLPLPGDPGQLSTISATVWNIGSATADNILVLFADSNGTIGTEQTIPILDPSQFATVSIQHSWPDTSYQLITVSVDPAGNIEELDDTNNTGSKVYQIGYPADANAILDVSWNSAPACYTEGTSAVIQGKAEYKIEIDGAPDIVSPALGSIVTAQMIDSNDVVTNLQSTLTGPGGYFYIPFIVPGAEYDSFTIEISVTDGTLTGAWEKLFCIQDAPDPDPDPGDPLRKDLWICELTLNDDTPDIGVPVNVCATVCAAPDNDETELNTPVTLYAYPPTGGAYQIDSNSISQLAAGENEEVCVNWTPTVNGLHRIKAIIGPGYSDDNNANNYRYYNVTVGMFTVTASPKWAVIGQQVQITVDAREQLPSGQLDSIAVKDSANQTIDVILVDQPTGTQWIYQTVSLPGGTALGTATITVTGTDSGSVQRTGQGSFEVYETPETVPDFWVHSCDISFSDLNPDLGELITIEAVIHADSSNPETESDIPVTFYSKHLPSNGDYIEIYQTQYTGDIVAGGVSDPVSVPWQNAAKGEYIIKVELGPGFSDRNNGNNAATRAILVGDDIPFVVDFEVVNKTRTGRWEFEYECNVRMHNQTGLTLENIQLELTGVSSNMTLLNPYTATIADVGPNGSSLSENTCTFRVDRSDPIDSAQISWDLIYQIVDICGIMQQSSTSVVLFDPIVLGDVTGEGVVNTDDLSIMANDWLQSGSIADIYPPPPDGDDIVNLLDFAVLAEHWLEGTTP